MLESLELKNFNYLKVDCTTHNKYIFNIQLNINCLYIFGLGSEGYWIEEKALMFGLEVEWMWLLLIGYSY